MGVVSKRWVWVESMIVIVGVVVRRYIGFLILFIIELVDSIIRDEPDSPLTQYITNAGISRARYTITLSKHHHRVLQLISSRISV